MSTKTVDDYSSIYIKNFFVLLSTTGEVVCTRSYQSENTQNAGMDNAALASFASSAKHFVNYVQDSKQRAIAKKMAMSSKETEDDEEVDQSKVHEFSFEREIYSFLKVGSHVLVAESGKGVGRQLAAQRLHGVRDMLLLLFGDPEEWSEDRFELDGLENVLDHLLVSNDPAFLMNGVRHVPLKTKAKDQIKRLVISFENNPLVHYTMITLGRSVLFSSFPVEYTRLVSEFLLVRPLGSVRSTTIPIYMNNVWCQLVITRFRSFNMAVVTNIDSRSELNPGLVAFEEKFYEAARMLPTEEPPVLLRHYADYKTAAFALVQPQTGMVLVPELRDGPGAENDRIKEIFQWFFCRAKDMKESYQVSITMSANVYLFHSMCFHGCEVYALFSDKVELSDVVEMCKDIVKTAKDKQVLGDTWD